MNRNDEHRYDDIIGLPHHTSRTRPRMSMADRAAQFSPFAALNGYDAAVKETARLTDRKIELSEDEQAVLDRKQAYLRSILHLRPQVSVTCFLPDAHKAGGAYVTVTGELKKIDDYERLLVFTTGEKIPFEDVLRIETEMP